MKCEKDKIRMKCIDSIEVEEPCSHYRHTYQCPKCGRVETI